MTGPERSSKERRFLRPISPTNREVVIALLALFIGIQLGILYAMGALPFIRDIFRGRTEADELGFVASVIVVAVGAILVSKILYRVWMRLSNWIQYLLVGLLGLSLLVFRAGLDDYLGWFMFLVCVALIGNPPTWIVFLAFVSAAAATEYFKIAGLWLGAIVLISLLRYPNQTTLRRYLIPRRGAL
jgi:hypothetical protein